jgi:hypothetical protein
MGKDPRQHSLWDRPDLIPKVLITVWDNPDGSKVAEGYTGKGLPPSWYLIERDGAVTFISDDKIEVVRRYPFPEKT